MHAIWKYLELNWEKLGERNSKMGFNILPYINYLLSNQEKYTGTFNQLWDLVKVLQTQHLVEKVEGERGFMYATKNKRVPIMKVDQCNTFDQPSKIKCAVVY